MFSILEKWKDLTGKQSREMSNIHLTDNGLRMNVNISERLERSQVKFKSEHTKGSWIAVGAWVEHEDDDTPDICNCDPESMGQEGRSYDEVIANVKLLAAAPAMFELLVEIVDHPDLYTLLRNDARRILEDICR